MKSICSVVFGLLLPIHGAVHSHYPFDSDYADSSGNGRHGTLTDVGTSGNSGIVTTAGDFKFGGGAMNFSADRDLITVPLTTFSSSSPYTIAFWARKTAGDTGDSANWDMVIGDVSNNFFIGLNDVNGTGMRWRGAGSTADRQADFAVAKDYNWHHYVIVGSGTGTGTGTITVYVDGTFFGTDSGNSTGFQFNTIGEAYSSSNNFDFHGQIDELWVFDEVLDATRIANLYQHNSVVAPVPPVTFHHRYDGDFTDGSGSGNHGTAFGSAAISADPASVVSGSGALVLDGADNSFVTLASPGAFDSTEPWTATWWARRGELGENKGMVMGSAASTKDFIWLNDNFTGLRFRSSTSATLDFTVPKDLELRHYALVADGAGNLALYLDGALSETLTGDTSLAIDTIGSAYPTTTLHYNFQGSLDEVRVLGSALDASAVATLYQTERPAVPVTRLRILLLGGQSNADGRAPTSDLPTSPVNLQQPQDDVDFFYRTEGDTAALTTLRPGLSETGQFGPEITLGRKMADLWAHETGTRVAIVKYANGGTNLAVHWNAGGDGTTVGDGPDYITFQTTVSEGLAALAAAHPGAILDLQGMVWLQGESDANASHANAYEVNLTDFIADIRATYGSDLPFAIARLSIGQTNLNATYLDQIRDAQDAVAASDRRTGIVDTDSFGLAGDNLHFNGSGQQSIGFGFAVEAAYYAWVIDTFPPADTDAGLAEPSADRDGDGDSNNKEFLAGTDPTSAQSRFTAAFTPTGAGTGEISYVSSASRFYSVERLVEPGLTWETHLPSQRGTGEVVSRSLDASFSKGIYRVQSELP